MLADIKAEAGEVGRPGLNWGTLPLTFPCEAAGTTQLDSGLICPGLQVVKCAVAVKGRRTRAGCS